MKRTTVLEVVGIAVLLTLLTIELLLLSTEDGLGCFRQDSQDGHDEEITP